MYTQQKKKLLTCSLKKNQVEKARSFFFFFLTSVHAKITKNNSREKMDLVAYICSSVCSPRSTVISDVTP